MMGSCISVLYHLLQILRLHKSPCAYIHDQTKGGVGLIDAVLHATTTKIL